MKNLHYPSIIEKKRDRQELSNTEIEGVINAFVSGEMSEAQMSALAMAVNFSGMTPEETGSLTRAMLNSGETLSYPYEHPPIIDKHSTGGIGDKVSLILAPLLAVDGNWVPMISGRGLGITGGTLDKLESIPGYRVDLSQEEIVANLQEIGCVITGQTSNICPADKKLYALRDVTGTIPAQSLIVSSIMSKKLAENLDKLVLDVKYGSGAFMKTKKEAKALGEAMKEVGNQFDVETFYILNSMNEPLGRSAGNALEVIESVNTLQGNGPKDLENIVLDLASSVTNTSKATLKSYLDDGSAFDKFKKMVDGQNGDCKALDQLENIHQANFIAEIKSPSSGVITKMDAGIIGQAVLELGGGRKKSTDPVDFSVGIDQITKTGQEIKVSDCLMRVHSNDKRNLQVTCERLTEAVEIS